MVHQWHKNRFLQLFKKHPLCLGVSFLLFFKPNDDLRFFPTGLHKILCPSIMMQKNSVPIQLHKLHDYLFQSMFQFTIYKIYSWFYQFYTHESQRNKDQVAIIHDGLAVPVSEAFLKYLQAYKKVKKACITQKKI